MKKRYFILPLSVFLFSSYLTASSMSEESETVYNQNQSYKTSPEQENEAITKTLKNLIQNNPALKNLNIQFTVNKGIVSYSGKVNSDSQASLLVEKASSIIGVSDVNTDKLEVKSSTQLFSDVMITAKIKGLLIRDDLFGEKDLASMTTHIETTDGVVYITGTVDNENQIKNAIHIIKHSVPGVKKIVYSVRYSLPENI